MITKEFIAQGIGILAMIFNILSYQGKSQKMVMTLQLFGGALFALNFLMLGATVGGILNIIAVIRAIAFLYKDKLKADNMIWFIGFTLSYITVYILNFTVLQKEISPYNLIMEFLPVIGMVALTIGFRLKDAADIRKCGLVSSPAWLIYNAAIPSWGAIICETLTLISIFIGMLRLDNNSSSSQ